MLKKIVFGLIIIGSFTGCLKNEPVNNTCNYDPCSYKAPAAEIQAVKDYLASNNITATEHCSGLYYVIDNPGSGKAVTACGAVKASYIGKLTNGKTFDQGEFNQFYPFSNLIRGWANGIPLIKQGGKIHLYIPSSLGYGSQDVKDSNGNVVIPANSVLIFEVTLTDIY
jgi:FKBP-type peptidyl-prolyl cis-trans isomerase FkpA